MDLKPFFSNTSATILVVAMEVSEVVKAPFHITMSPQMNAMAQFQPDTASGKLKAVMTPIIPSGFHTSIMK
jgi:hypothetical protein